MRTWYLFVLALLLLPVTLAHGQRPANVLEGTWEMITQKQIYPDTTVVRAVERSIKILNSTHFSFGRQIADGEDIYGGGGRYTLVGDTVYTEYIEYHSSAPLVGTDISFECKVEGDIWYHRGHIGDSILEEVWRRIK